MQILALLGIAYPYDNVIFWNTDIDGVEKFTSEIDSLVGLQVFKIYSLRHLFYRFLDRTKIDYQQCNL